MKTKEDNSCMNCNSLCSSIFNKLDKEVLNQSDKNKISNVFKKGQTLFLQGNPPFGVFCIKSGTVKVSQNTSEGKESIVRLSKAGDLVGHRSLLTNQSYQATATALEDTKVCFFDKAHIDQLIKDQPQIAFNLIHSMGQDLGEAEAKVSSFSKNTVRQRLAELLIFLAKNHGIIEGSRTKISLILKRDEMASLVGTASETLIRFMTELKKENLIEQDGKTIYLLDIERLIEFADIKD